MELKKRVEKLEAAGSGSDFEDRLRALAPLFGLAPERLIRIAGPHKAVLGSFDTGADGASMTIEQFETLYRLLQAEA